MATINRRGKKWVAEVRSKGFYKSQTFESKIEAQGWALEVEAGLGKFGKVVKGKTFGDALRRYADKISPAKKGARWEAVRLKKLEKDFLSEISLVNISASDFRKWIEKRSGEVSPSTVNRELNLISSVLKECRARWRWMEHNPLADVKRPKDPPPRDRRWSQKDIERILLALEYEEDLEIKTTRQQIAVAVLLALETAMRRGEIWGLRWDNVHLKERYIHLPETKNGTKRNVPLSSRAVVLIEKMQSVKNNTGKVFTCSETSTETIFRRMLNLAGLKDLRFHDLRHEAITRLAKKLDVLDLARMVGHRDPRSLMIYYNATASEIAGLLD
ncbi:MAG: site-specific integrase [Rickettsiales bacterium]